MRHCGIECGSVFSTGGSFGPAKKNRCDCDLRFWRAQLQADDVRDVLRRCAGLLGLDEDDLVRSATLLHGTSVVTDLKEDLEAVTPPKSNPP